MIFFSLALLVPAIWFLPWWWATALLPFSLGVGLAPALGRESRWAPLQFGLAAGLASAALAFIKDGRSGAIISARMAGLFSLPSSSLVFLFVFLLAFVTAALTFAAGFYLRRPGTIA